MEHAIPVSCDRDCLGGCPLLAYVSDGRITRIANNPAGGPHLRGCSKGFGAHRFLDHPSRLRTPLLRTGERGSGQFRPIPWDEALDRAADGLRGIVERHGPQAILSLGGSGSCRAALHNTYRLPARFLALLGGYTATRGSYSAAATSFAAPFVLGTNAAGSDPATLQHSQLVLLWGANVADCRFGAELEHRLLEASRRNCPIIVLDPRRTATVRRLSARWMPIRPGTDSALMLAMLYVLATEGLIDQAFVARYTCGYEALLEHVMGADGSPPETPDWAAAICGLPATEIVALARLYGRSKPVALLPGLAMQRTIGGEEAVRLAIALQAVTGNLGVLGGSTGAFSPARLPTPRVGALPIPQVRNRPSVPVYRWADAVLQGRSGGFPSDIRAIYNVGGNELGQGPDVHKSVRAFQSVEFSLCHDLFLTPTARHCDLVLPATHYLERNDITFPAGNYLFFSNRAVAHPDGCRHDYDIFCALANRLGFGAAFSEGKDEEEWLRTFVAHSDVPDYDEFRRTGIVLGRDQARVGLSAFLADPDRHPLSTPSGRVELASALYHERTGFPAVPHCRPLPPAPGYPLALVTPHPRERVHSQGAQMPEIMHREPQRLWLHPADALDRGVVTGQKVLVRSAQGKVCVPALVTEDIMPGVVALNEGAWPDLDQAGIDWGGCPNTLTPTEPTLPSEGSRTHSVWVEVSPL
ncbi:MAG: molybdopterin-containing oxidoreductase family protein [Anaerolineae bacterium]